MKCPCDHESVCNIKTCVGKDKKFAAQIPPRCIYCSGISSLKCHWDTIDSVDNVNRGELFGLTNLTKIICVLLTSPRTAKLYYFARPRKLIPAQVIIIIIIPFLKITQQSTTGLCKYIRNRGSYTIFVYFIGLRCEIQFASRAALTRFIHKWKCVSSFQWFPNVPRRSLKTFPCRTRVFDTSVCTASSYIILTSWNINRHRVHNSTYLLRSCTTSSVSI